MWVRYVGWGLFALGVAVACSGQSSKSVRGESTSTGGHSGSQSSSGEGGGQLGGTSASGTAGVDAPVGGVSGMGGGGSSGADDVGGSSGVGGSFGTGGSSGSDTCACPNSMCTLSLEEVCSSPCRDLDARRRGIRASCADFSFSGAVYEECAGGLTSIRWSVYSENFYTYVFDETGALVFYDASGYGPFPGCVGLHFHVTAGTLPPLTDCRSCWICSAGDGGDGGQGGVGAEELAGRPGCVIDAEGRIALPP